MPLRDDPADPKRIDYRPGPAALEALREGAERWPELNLQAMVDKLVICGLSALTFEHWRPPPLHGKQRNRWRTGKR